MNQRPLIAAIAVSLGAAALAGLWWARRDVAHPVDHATTQASPQPAHRSAHAEGSGNSPNDRNPTPSPLQPVSAWRPEPGELARLTAECEARVAGACAQLARTLLTSGDPADRATGLQRALADCGNGDAESCGIAGQTAADLGTPLPEPHTADSLLATACAAGFAPYCASLDKLRGLVPPDPDPVEAIAAQGVANDVAIAAAAEQRAERCRQGDDAACAEAANDALLRDPTDAAAREVMRERCAALPEVCATLADHLARTDSTVDQADAIAVAQSGCDRGATLACELLPKLRGEVVEDPYLAMHAAREHERSADDGARLGAQRAACETGDAAACIDAARMINSNLGAVRDDVAIVALLRRACDAQSHEGCVELGIALLQNQSADVGASIGEVATLFNAACDAGFEPGCEQATKLALR